MGAIDGPAATPDGWGASLMPLTLGLSSRDRRTLIVGVVVIGGIFGAGRGWPAFHAWQTGSHEELAVLRDSVANLDRLHALRPALTAYARRARERLAFLDSVMVGGVVPAAASAELASLLRESADEAGLQLTSITVTSDSVWRGGLAKVRARLLATGNVVGLTALLASIEGAPAVLIVTELSVGQPEPMAARSRPEQLHLELAVSALARERPSRAGTAP